jgi:DedD protein
VDRRLKERLIGAAVLVTAAIVLIPELLLSVPKRTQIPTSAPTSDSSGVKTYTIDLTAPVPAPGAALPAPAPAPDAAPAPELAEPTAPAVEIAAAPQAAAATEAVAVLPIAVPAEKPAPEPSMSPPTPTANVPANKPEHPATPAVARPAKPDSGSWAVQVASLGTRAGAEGIAREAKSKGLAAFVAEFSANGKTMYRVRVGPVSSRDAGDALLAKVKRSYPKAVLVTQ